MEDGPLLRQVLALGEPGRVVAGLSRLLLCPAPEHAPTLDLVSARALQAASRPRSYVGVIGPDAASYLQRMVSNDVEALGPGEACQALLLTAKARLIAPLTVLRRGTDDFLLLTEPDPWRPCREGAAPVPVRCEVLDRAGGALIDDRVRRAGTAGSIPTRDYGVPAYEVLDADRSLPPDARRRGGARATPDPRRHPAWGRELDDRVLPAEAGLEERAISFTKGCYPGQEPVARLHYRGHPNRGLRVLELEGATSHVRRGADPRRQGRRADHERGRRRRRRDRARLRAARGARRRGAPPRLRLRDTATLSLPAPVAQGIERCPAEAEVARSNRAGRTERRGNPWFPHEPLLLRNAQLRSVGEPPGRRSRPPATSQWSEHLACQCASKGYSSRSPRPVTNARPGRAWRSSPVAC